jgi:hypothetical protein
VIQKANVKLHVVTYDWLLALGNKLHYPAEAHLKLEQLVALEVLVKGFLLFFALFSLGALAFLGLGHFTIRNGSDQVF